MRARLSILPLLSILAAGCPKPRTPPPPPPAPAPAGGSGSHGGAVPVADETDAWCESAWRCHDSYEEREGAMFTFEDIYGESAADCDYWAQVDFTAASVAASEEAGRITYDEDEIATCRGLVAQWGSMSCEDRWAAASPADTACGRAIVGTVAAGGTCTEPFDCAGDAFCNATVCGARSE